MRTPLAPSDATDIIYSGEDTAQRYLGHDKAVYGFVLESPKFPGGKEFIFPLNPQSIEQDEESAIVITPTQGGGQFIENQGNLFKGIVISGTTGFLPLKNVRDTPGATLVAQAASRVASGTSASTAAANSKVSGYHTFHTLRSLFREYLDIHKLKGQSIRSKTFLYWVNLKDNETWLVEPLSFRMTRSSRKPMTYDYSIRLRTISKGTVGLITADKSSFTIIDAIQSGLAAIRDRIDAANALVRASLGFFQQYQNLRTQLLAILDVGSQVSQSLTTVASGIASVLDFPRSLLASASANIFAVYEGMEAAADLISAPPLDLLEGLTTLRQQFDFLGARKELYAKKWSEKWDTTTNDFNRAYGTHGDAEDALLGPSTRSGLVEATPGKNENIYTFSLRVTGDATRAHEIIVINNLRWPYFAPSAEERSPGTVAPGDTLLVPVDFADSGSGNLITNTVHSTDRTFAGEVGAATSLGLTKLDTVPWRTDEWIGYTVELADDPTNTRLIVGNTTQGLTIDRAWSTTPPSNALFRVYFKRLVAPPSTGIVELLGVDLRVTEDSLTGLWDIVRDSRGDLGTIQGQDNLNQALGVKFRTQQGDLVLHTWFGLAPVFGQRGTPEALFRLRVAFEQTLLSDSRIEAVQELVVEQVRDQYRTSSKLAVKGGLRSKFVSPLV